MTSFVNDPLSTDNLFCSESTVYKIAYRRARLAWRLYRPIEFRSRASKSVYIQVKALQPSKNTFF